ncbi:histidine phosphatase family protein [Streptomyces sp. NRRL F-2799]|uniref:histidine phosphatase family protein n=1 Tax=Streptomyces sp. NRRL F-2799 TaxID=1463844 RepID=UPI001F1E027F|nr:histidine phosphatase family protein [Streptomyces sp. NRRL F-2799]
MSGILNRQRDTARLIADAAGFKRPLQEDPRWNEYDHLALVARYVPSSQTASVQGLLDHALMAWTQGSGALGGESWTTFAEGGSAALADLSASLGRGPRRHRRHFGRHPRRPVQHPAVPAA